MKRWTIKCVGLFAWPVIQRSLLRTVNVAYYHHVGERDPHLAAFDSACTPERFAEDLRILGRMFDFVSLEEVLAEDLTEGRRRPTLALTFDDGFDLRKHGTMEVLDRAGIKATTFVVTSTIGNRMLMWRYMLSAIQTRVSEPVWRRQYSELATRHGLSPLADDQTLLGATARHWDMARKDKLAAELWKECGLAPVEEYLAEKRPYFDWDGLREWLRAGHSIGFHTHTHPFCSRLSPAEIETELIQPATQLKQRLGLDELWLSYPFGDRLAPDMERSLYDKGLFRAFFGTEGFTRREGSNGRLGRLSFEGYPAEEQIISERLWAFRRQLLSLGRFPASLGWASEIAR